MKNNVIVLMLSAFFIFLNTSALGQVDQATNSNETEMPKDHFKYAINMCPGGIVFGVYSVNFEYLVSPNHGLVARFDYEVVPDSYTDAAIESSGIGFTFNYRWHISGGLNSFYLGAYSRYKVYTGDGSLESNNFDFTLSDYSIGLNAGKRWAWNNGLNINVAFGYGISSDTLDSNPSNMEIETIMEEFKDEYEFIDPFYGEISVGYAF
jgi:hypothetical protein